MYTVQETGLRRVAEASPPKAYCTIILNYKDNSIAIYIYIYIYRHKYMPPEGPPDTRRVISILVACTYIK